MITTRGMGAVRAQFKKGGSPAWTRKEGKSESGGLNQKERDSYNKANPGSNLKAPQPEGGSRKKSFIPRIRAQKDFFLDPPSGWGAFRFDPGLALL